MVKLVMRKRAARHAGEIGLFVDAEMFEEELASIKIDNEVEVDAKTKRSLKQHKFIWALATKVAEACDFLETKDDAYNYMLIEAKHARYIYDHRREISYAIPKATNWGAMDGSAFTKLAKRITHIVGTHIVPGIDNNLLRAEIEKMLNPDLIPTDDRPEPPPITEIPEGPGMGHNSSRAGEGSAAAPAADDRAPEPEASPEPPEARQTASRPGPDGGTVALQGVKTTDPGEPDWSVQVPADVGSYMAYARFHIQEATGAWNAREWLNTPDQWQLRQQIGMPIGYRKQLERYCDEHHEAKK